MGNSMNASQKHFHERKRDMRHTFTARKTSCHSSSIASEELYILNGLANFHSESYQNKEHPLALFRHM
jgi:hypothetical protein